MDTLEIVITILLFLLFGTGNLIFGYLISEIKHLGPSGPIEIEVYRDQQVTLTMRGHPVFTGRVMNIETNYENSLYGDSSANIHMISNSKFLEVYRATEH